MGPPRQGSESKWSATICLAGSACIVTAVLHVKASMEEPAEKSTTGILLATTRDSQDTHRLIPSLWSMADEDAPPASYEYRERSRDVDRARKLGRSRDERGEDSQRSIRLDSTWGEHNNLSSGQSGPGESVGDTKNEKFSGEKEEDS